MCEVCGVLSTSYDVGQGTQDQWFRITMCYISLVPRSSRNFVGGKGAGTGKVAEE